MAAGGIFSSASGGNFANGAANGANVYSESGINYYGLYGNIFSWTSIESTGNSITVFYNLD